MTYQQLSTCSDIKSGVQPIPASTDGDDNEVYSVLRPFYAFSKIKHVEKDQYWS